MSGIRLPFIFVVSRIMPSPTAPKEVHVQMLGIYESVTSCGKRDLADVIKPGVMRWGDYLVSSGWAQCNQMRS